MKKISYRQIDNVHRHISDLFYEYGRLKDLEGSSEWGTPNATTELRFKLKNGRTFTVFATKRIKYGDKTSSPFKSFTKKQLEKALLQVGLVS